MVLGKPRPDRAKPGESEQKKHDHPRERERLEEPTVDSLKHLFSLSLSLSFYLLLPAINAAAVIAAQLVMHLEWLGRVCPLSGLAGIPPAAALSYANLECNLCKFANF